MEKKSLKKYYSLGTIIIGVIIIASISNLYLANRNQHPFDTIREMRSNIAEDHELIKIEKTEKGTMVYSVGKVNNGADNMYFADMVQKSLMGYNWVGGGSHINRYIDQGKGFVFSAQLLNEEQNVRPTIFGVFLNEKIRNITVRVPGNESYRAVIFDEINEGEQFYYIPISNSVSDCRNFIFVIRYENNVMEEYVVTGDEIARFQEGRQIYFY